MNKKLLSLLISAAACGSAQANLISNGDFEAAAGAVAAGGYTPVAAGATTIPNWTVSGREVDLINASYGAPNGVAVDILGSPGPGAIYQLFSVVAGTTYNLTFDLAGNGPGPHSLLLNFGTLVETIDYTFTSVQNIARSFTATTSGEVAVSFGAVSNGSFGPVVDNVNVNAVPLPGSLALLGIGLLAGGLRRQFKK